MEAVLAAGLMSHMPGLLAAPLAPPAGSTGVSPAAHRRMLLVTGAAAAATLLLTAGIQIYDANLYVMAEATALLAGDRPGVDFYWWGTPLESYLAAAAQIASGHRLIGEFARQWLFIVAGVVVAFHLGLLLSRSIAAVAAVLVPTLVVLANTPTYHSSKLFFFPLFLWLAWRYLDRPGTRRACWLGIAAGTAFLSRHDYGVYLGIGSVLALVFGHVVSDSPRRASPLVTGGLACGLTAALVIAPWAAAVQRTEGLVEYARTRLALFDSAGFPYAALVRGNPLRLLLPEPLPPATPGVIRFVWRPDLDDSRQRELEQRHRLRPIEGLDGRGRLGFEVPNLYDPGLLKLEPFIRDPAGIPWDRLKEAGSRLPSHAHAEQWLQRVALVVPLLLIAAGSQELWRRRGNRAQAIDGWRLILGGAFLAIVHAALFREPSYVVVTAPLTAALGARLVAARTAAGRACALVLLALTVYAAAVWARRTPLFQVSELRASLSGAFTQLLASPPVEGRPRYRYLYECMAEGDRLLLTGSTPGYVSYYAGRPIAGGHVAWHQGWRSDPHHEAQSLELLQRQSVPFAVSTHDPVLKDFERYPRIHQYLETHYVVLPGALDGTFGTVLVDTRRRPVRGFGPEGYPCFR